MKIYHISEKHPVRKLAHGDVVLNGDEAHQVTKLMGSTLFFGHCDPALAEEARKAWAMVQGVHSMTPKRFVEWVQVDREKWWGRVNGANVFNIVGSSEDCYHLNSCTIPATLPVSAGEWIRDTTNYQVPVEHFDGIYDVFESLEALQLLCEAEFSNWIKGV